MVNLPVVDLKALLRREGRLATLMLAEERLETDVDQHVLLEVRLLRELFPAMDANVFLLLLVNLSNVTIESILRAEDELAFGAMELTGSFVDLVDVLSQSLRVEVDFAALLARLLHRLLRHVDPVFVLDKAVVRLEPF